MRTSSDEILRSLVHDLRQPLGNLETGLFYLDLVLDQPSERIRDQMQMMERQIAHVNDLLLRVSEELRNAAGQRATEGLPRPKVATATVA